MAEAGLRVAAVAPAQHALHRMDAIATTRVCAPRSGFIASVAAAAAALRPTIIVPGDDRAVRGLHALHGRMAREPGPAAGVAAVIRRSLGDPSSFPVAAQKSRFAAFCEEEGLPIPNTVTLRRRSQFHALLATRSLPQVLKIDGKWGGRGVRIARSSEEAAAAFDDLIEWRGWWSAIRSALEEMSPVPVLDRIRDRAPVLTMQSYVAGTLANRAVYCRDGSVLAGVTVATVRVGEETGPTTVARVIDHPEVASLTQRIVRRLNLSGFIGIDVVLEEGSGRPWLIELNPRPTQICHFAFNRETDMVGALAQELRGTTLRTLPRDSAVEGRVVAFYPGEAWRDPSSAYLRAIYHDVPWHEPQFVAAYARPLNDDPPTWLQALARLRPFRSIRRRWSAIGATETVETMPIVPASSESVGSGG